MLFFARMLALVSPLLLLGACYQEGPAERTGKSLDNAAQSAKDAIDPPGPAEKAGRALDRATQ